MFFKRTTLSRDRVYCILCSMKRDQTNRKYFQFDYDGERGRTQRRGFRVDFVLDFSDKRSEPLLLTFYPSSFIFTARD